MKKSLQKLQDSLPEFIDLFYPKRKDKDRGVAIVAIVQFLHYIDGYSQDKP